MYKLVQLSIFCLLHQMIFGQKSINTNATTIEIVLTNSSKKPLQNEKIILASTTTKKSYVAITNHKGLANITVDAGNTFVISLITLNDTTKYGDIEIPALAANQKYSTPFKIDMTYEPAKSYTFHHLEFDVARYTIKPISYAELNLLVEYLQLKKEVTIEIIGHTDNKGLEIENKKLSLARAESVKNYLTKKGIATTRIKTTGKGDAEPIADNNTEEGRQQNRRTEIKFID